MLVNFEALCDNESGTTNLWAEHDEVGVIHEAALMAPIIDRVGRMMTDLSPHLTNMVFKH